MMIEIRKAGFVNKGAELMLYAIVDKIKQQFPDVKIVVAPHIISQPYEKRIKFGFYQKAHYWKYRMQWGWIANFIPKKFRMMYGIVLNKEIDVVLDASGFSYSDQWGIGECKELATSSKEWKKNKTNVILLPQAFGPFTSNKIKKYISIALKNIDLVYAREQISYNYLKDIVGERNNIKVSADFTNLIKGVIPETFDIKNNRFCIVPNYRMIDKVSKEQSEAYLPFLIKCVKYLLKNNQKPFILVHEGHNDMLLAKKINEAVGGKLPIVFEDDALKIKGILGVCEGTIGSRFHGLVSALSQGVPSLATGWSHKYKMLFEDYKFEDGLIDVMAEESEIYKKIDLIIEQKSKENIQKILLEQSVILKEKSEDMWKDIFALIKER